MARGDLVFVVGVRSHGALIAKLVLFAAPATGHADADRDVDRDVDGPRGAGRVGESDPLLIPAGSRKTSPRAATRRPRAPSAHRTQGTMADLRYPSHRRADQPELRAGDLVLDEARWTVFRGDRQVDLSPTEFRLLAYLMRNQGQVLTRAQLLKDVWGWNKGAQSQVVETYVSYLRRKLDALGPRLIHTRRGAGYLLRPAEAQPSITASHRDEPARLSYPRIGRTAVR